MITSILLDRQLVPWLYKVNYYYRIHNSPYSKGLLNSLSQSDRSFVKHHLENATASLQHKHSQFEIAGAINDYIYQLLRVENNVGDPIKVLQDKHAICGGHAIAMSLLLEQAGIENRLAYLLDVPYQGAHSLVQVRFSNGTEGLYDPTFGILWRDSKRNTSLSLADLKRHPEWAGTKMLRTNHRKGSGVPTEPFYSVAENYRSFADKGEIHYREMFDVYANAGISDHRRKLFRTIPIDSLPLMIGSMDTQDIGQSIHSLATAQDSADHPLSWLHLLGKHAFGENVSHIYEFANLTPGHQYSVMLGYARSIESTLSAVVLGGAFDADTRSTKHITLDNYAPRLSQLIRGNLTPKSRQIELQFTASRPNPCLVINNEGEMVLHGLLFQEVTQPK